MDRSLPGRVLCDRLNDIHLQRKSFSHGTRKTVHAGTFEGQDVVLKRVPRGSSDWRLMRDEAVLFAIVPQEIHPRMLGFCLEKGRTFTVLERLEPFDKRAKKSVTLVERVALARGIVRIAAWLNGEIEGEDGEPLPPLVHCDMHLHQFGKRPTTGEVLLLDIDGLRAAPIGDERRCSGDHNVSDAADAAGRDTGGMRAFARVLERRAQIEGVDGGAARHRRVAFVRDEGCEHHCFKPAHFSQIAKIDIEERHCLVEEGHCTGYRESFNIFSMCGYALYELLLTKKRFHDDREAGWLAKFKLARRMFSAFRELLEDIVAQSTAFRAVDRPTPSDVLQRLAAFEKELDEAVAVDRASHRRRLARKGLASDSGDDDDDEEDEGEVEEPTRVVKSFTFMQRLFRDGKHRHLGEAGEEPENMRTRRNPHEPRVARIERKGLRSTP